MKKIGILFWDEFRDGYQSHEINKTFIQAIENARGLAIGIPSVMYEKEMDEYLAYVDGIVLTGGQDISPFLYGEEPLKETKDLNLKRDRSESAFIKKAFERKIPMLTVCRGMQLANVCFGGSLYQDIEKQRLGSLTHFQEPDPGQDFRHNYHTIEIEENSHLYKCLGSDHIVNSYHHQAIKDLANIFKVTARSKDRLIEAIETKDDHFFIGIQFHPEFLEDSENFQGIFNYFIGGIN